MMCDSRLFEIFCRLLLSNFSSTAEAVVCIGTIDLKNSLYDLYIRNGTQDGCRGRIEKLFVRRSKSRFLSCCSLLRISVSNRTSPSIIRRSYTVHSQQLRIVLCELLGKLCRQDPVCSFVTSTSKALNNLHSA